MGATNSCRICDKVSLNSGRLERGLAEEFFDVSVEDSRLQFVFCTGDAGSVDRRGLSRRGMRLVHESAKPRVEPAVRQKFVVATALDDLPALEHEDLIGVTNS